MKIQFVTPNHMEITFYYKDLSKKEEGQFIKYVEQKIPAIESLLTKFAQDAKTLNANIEKFEKHDAYSVELCLTLPTKSIVAKEASHSITKAVDLSKDRLVTQIKKHIAMLRKDRAHRSIRKAPVKKEVPSYIE